MATFYDQFAACAERWPGQVALEIECRDGRESYTYSDLRRRSESIARWLVEQGQRPGSRLAILADNHPRWTAAYLGGIAAGCTVVPLDTAFHADQVAKLLKDSGSSLLFTDSRHLPVARQAVSGLPLDIVLTAPSTGPAGPEVGTRAPSQAEPLTDLDTIFARGPGHFRAVSAGSDESAALLYTSGTTADPKGVILTHGNLLGECDAVFGLLELGPGDAVLGVLPLFHALAQMANLLLPLVKGARVVYLESLNSAELLRALREREITAFACVPQFFYLIHERIHQEVARRGRLAEFTVHLLMRLTRFFRALGWNSGKLFFRPIHHLFGKKMRYLITGASRWDPEVGRDFYSLGIDILQAYGLTETCGGAMCTPPTDNVIGSVGKALPTVQVEIVDPESQDMGPAVGEIAIRGPIVMKGYWNRPEATARVLRQGWLHTGDLGYFDHAGNLFITGRRKEVIVLSSGKNVYPEEIEAHYQKSPFIKEICVLGLVSPPGEPFSERLHGVIVPNFEVLRQRKIVNAREVIRFDIEGLSHQLPSSKRILSYEIWQGELARTTTRKLKRFEIERRVRAHQSRSQAESQMPAEPALSADDLDWLEQPQVERALTIIRTSVKSAPDTIRPAANLELDLGLDSIQRVELLLALEQELGGDVDESRISEIYTVRELVDAVCQSAARERPIRAPARFAGWNAILSEESKDPEVLRLAKPRPISAATLFLIFRLLQLFARDQFDLRVTGLEKLPGRGPFILAPNHQSFVDPFVVGSVLPWEIFRDLFSVGTSEIFGSGVMRRIAGWLRVIVVDPDANLLPAMRAGAYGLRRGRVLVLFPEGERSIDGKPKVFKKGTAILSLHLQVPIVPVAIEGFYEVWPRGKALPQKFNPLQMRFGDPIYPPRNDQPTEQDYAQLTALLRERLVDMWHGLGAIGWPGISETTRAG
jgi:long-chain acyl-CoA synthetase